MRQIKINTIEGTEIVSQAEFKDFARISTTEDDAIVNIVITAARIWCENYISRDIVSKTRTYYVPETTGIFDIPFGPIDSIDSVTIDGSAFTGYTMLGLDNETIDLDGPAEKIKINYTTSGLNDNLLHQAIKQLAVTLYENRSDFEEGKIGSIVPTSTKMLLNDYKNMFI